MIIIKRLLLALSIALAVAVVAVIWLGVDRNEYVQVSDRYRNQLDAVYQKSWWETIERTESLELEIEKLLLSDNPNAASLRLQSIARQADSAQDNLGMLPIQYEGVGNAIKFINQTADYCRALSEGIASGRAISDEDYTQLENIYASLAELNSRFYAAEDLRGWQAEDIDISSLVQENLTYPTLIYDGPFSDGDEGSYKALGTDKADETSAAQYAAQFSGGEVTSINSSIAPINGYDIVVSTPRGSLDLFVTESGGQVLYMMPEFAPGEATLTQEQCIELAEQFLLSRGFEGMRANYAQSYSGVTVANFAAEQNGILLYPDLVKVQVAMDDGAIIGIEAGNYWKNHVSRLITPPVLTYGEAVARVSTRLQILSSQLVIIPTDAGERMCYEFSCTNSNGNYLVYIDASTGFESRILKIVEGGVL